ncbi:unnamed protein product, partial [marine sediment metagenome]
DSNDDEVIFAHTVAEKDNRLMVLGIVSDLNGGEAPEIVEFNGKPFTQQPSGNPEVIEFGSTCRLTVWAIIMPDVGTHNILIDFGAIQTTIIAMASSWYNVDQTGAGGNHDSAKATADAGPITVDIVSSGAEIVIDIAACTDNDETMTATLPEQTEVSGAGGVQVGDVRLGSSYETGAAATTMSWALGNPCSWATWSMALYGTKPGLPYLYAQRGKKSGSSSTAKVNKFSLSNIDFGVTS